MPSRKSVGPSQANPAWTTLPEELFAAILDKLGQRSALAAARSTCKAWKASVSLHLKSLAVSDEALPPCAAAFLRLQSLKVNLHSSSAVLDAFSNLSALRQLQSLTLALDSHVHPYVSAREMSQLPGSIRQLTLSGGYISTKGLSQLPSLAQLRVLDIRRCDNLVNDPQNLLEVLPELKSLEVFGVGRFWDGETSGSDQEAKHREFWDTLCRLSCLTALQLERYHVPGAKETSLSDLDYPAGLKDLEMDCISLSGNWFSGMLGGFPQVESLKVRDLGLGEWSREQVSLQGVGGLTSLSLSSTTPQWSTLEALPLRELRLVDIACKEGVSTIASMQQLTRLELDPTAGWGLLQPLQSLNLKELVFSRDTICDESATLQGVCRQLLVPGSLQSLEVLDVGRTDTGSYMWYTSTSSTEAIDREIAVAIMLLPKLKILAGKRSTIRKIVDQNPNLWAACTADDIVDKCKAHYNIAYGRVR